MRRGALEREARSDAPKPTAETLARLGRPSRGVTPPTITPSDLDRMVDESLGGKNVAPARQADDEVFIRRVTLDLTGKPPTPKDVARFVGNKDPRKRQKSIDQLLDSPDFALNWARYWRDVIAYHATAEQPRRVNFADFETWLSEQFQANRPWDEIVTEMLTATGQTDESGATALLVAHSTNQRFQPVELAGEASRIFLGVQIACAQCHDHKTDSWKRTQFHEFAAFFAGTQVRRMPKAQNAPFVRVVRDQRGAPRHAMPDLENPEKLIPVTPQFFLASLESVPGETDGLDAAELRALAASYITGQDNPWFARAFVNRIWYELVSEAFYMPIDDIGPEREAQSPEILDALASQWAGGGYDIKWLYQTILNTRLYERQSRSSKREAGLTPFAAACPSRLRSDQIFDALSQALDIPPGGRLPARPNDAMAAGPAAGALAPARPGLRQNFNMLFGVDPSTPRDEVMGTIPQALFLMNHPQINRLMRSAPRTALGKILAENPDDRMALQAVYLKVLARGPNDDELRVCGQHIQQVGGRAEAFEDIYWALVNSTEFVSRH
jgi:hypothetical protein